MLFAIVIWKMLGDCVGVHCFTPLYKNGWLTDCVFRNSRNLAVGVIVSHARNGMSCILFYIDCVSKRLNKTLVSRLILISRIDKSQAFKLLYGSQITSFIAVFCI
jgi:hypothetical protein